jgi:Ni/Co efflux regulator RcnB
MFKRVGMFTIALAGVLTFLKPATASAQDFNYRGRYAQTYREPARDREWNQNRNWDRRQDVYRAQEFRGDERRDDRGDWRRQERFERNDFDRGHYAGRPLRGYGY